MVGHNNLYGILHSPLTELRDQCVLLISGFSLSMCDMDYFMSRLARYLCQNGFYVLQLDPRGHGDSKGNLEEVSLDTYKEDMWEGISFLSSNLKKDVYIISRGLGATLAAEFVNDNKAKGIVGIGPYFLSNDISESIWKGLEKKEYYEGIELLPGQDFRTLTDFDIRKVAFFNAIGVRIRNILGQVVSANLMTELVYFNYRAFMEVDKDKSIWLFHSDEIENGVQQIELTENLPITDLDIYTYHAFKREPIWQLEVMKVATNWILEIGG